MRRLRRVAAGGAALAALAIPHAIAGASPAATPVTTARATALGRLAFLYGFPLLEFLRVREDRDQRPLPRRPG